MDAENLHFNFTMHLKNPDQTYTLVLIKTCFKDAEMKIYSLFDDNFIHPDERGEIIEWIQNLKSNNGETFQMILKKSDLIASASFSNPQSLPYCVQGVTRVVKVNFATQIELESNLKELQNKLDLLLAQEEAAKKEREKIKKEQEEIVAALSRKRKMPEIKTASDPNNETQLIPKETAKPPAKPPAIVFIKQEKGQSLTGLKTFVISKPPGTPKFNIIQSVQLKKVSFPPPFDFTKNVEKLSNPIAVLIFIEHRKTFEDLIKSYAEHFKSNSTIEKLDVNEITVKSDILRRILDLVATEMESSEFNSILIFMKGFLSSMNVPLSKVQQENFINEVLMPLFGLYMTATSSNQSIQEAYAVWTNYFDNNFNDQN